MTAIDYQHANAACRRCGLKARHHSESDCIQDLLRILGVLKCRVWPGNVAQCIAGLREAIASLEDRGPNRARRGRG